MEQYKIFELWLDKHLSNELLPNVQAVNFNLYDASRGEHDFDMQLIGAPKYDPDDSDWACDAIFTTGEDLCPLKATDWEKCLQVAVGYIRKYICEGRYAYKISNLLAVTVGFVDGDLETVIEN